MIKYLKALHSTSGLLFIILNIVNCTIIIKRTFQQTVHHTTTGHLEGTNHGVQDFFQIFTQCAAEKKM